MSFLLVDNNINDLNNLADILKKVVPAMELKLVQSAEDALNLQSLNFDAAFIEIDLEPDKMNGLDLAAKLKAFHKDVHIIFITRNKNFYSEAFTVHADNYLIKPVNITQINNEIDYLSRYYPLPLRTKGKVYIQTFGGFNIYVDGVLVEFKRSKTKELLALLVDRRGAAVNVREACDLLFSDRPYNTVVNGYYHVLVHSLIHTFMDYGIDNILIRRKNFLAIKPALFECDAYNFLKGDPSAAKQYRGDYLSCYKWAQQNKE
ncbi:MAG: response regulator [Synergistaceae bacterium]|nr:response regulator [Synergistaceae bacterium]